MKGMTASMEKAAAGPQGELTRLQQKQQMREQRPRGRQEIELIEESDRLSLGDQHTCGCLVGWVMSVTRISSIRVKADFEKIL